MTIVVSVTNFMVISAVILNSILSIIAAKTASAAGESIPNP